MAALGLLILGAYCFLASIWGPDFAKLHLSLSFLDFPLFVGEIVLLACLGISLGLILRKKVVWTRPMSFFFTYLMFILLWSAYYYFHIQGPPLVLRNAVLFFYPIFALFAYCFYDPSFFAKKPVQLALVLLLIAVSAISKVPFFSFIYLILVLILAHAIMPQPWRYVLWAAVLCLWPYGFVFSGARTWLVASVIAGLFLVFVFTKYFLKMKAVGKIMAGLAGAAMVVGLAVHFADKGGLKTLTTPMAVIQGYKKVKKEIRQREKFFHPDNLHVQLYHQEDDRQALSNMAVGYKEYPPLKCLSLSGPSDAMSAFSAAPLAQLIKVPTKICPSPVPQHRNVVIAYNDIYFRLLIWEDMLRELWEGKDIFGVGLAKPQRSRNIEIMNWAYGEWSRDGWITPHNSFLHLIYRAGIIGLAIIVVIFMLLGRVIKDFVDNRSVAGILLAGIVIYTLVSANFLLILELPYYAIPFWSLFGLMLAYRHNLLEKKSWLYRKPI